MTKNNDYEIIEDGDAPASGSYEVLEDGDNLAGGEVRGPAAMRTRRGATGTAANAARFVVPTAVGIGAGMLSGGNPWASTAAAAVAQGVTEYALGSDAGGAADTAVISGVAGGTEEAAQQALLRRAPQAALRLLQRRLGIPDGVLQTMAPAALSALSNIATTMFVKGGAPTVNEGIQSVFFGAPGALRTRRLPGSVRMPEQNPTLPNKAFLAEEGSPEYRRLNALSRDDFASDIIREEALRERAKQDLRAPDYLGTTDPASPQVADDLATIRSAAQAGYDLQADRNLKLNRQIEDITRQGLRTVGEQEELRVLEGQTARLNERNALQSDIDLANEQAARQYEADVMRQRQEREAQIQQNETQYRQQTETYGAERASWEAQQAALKQAQEAQRMGQQIEVMQGLPGGEPINPSDAIAGAAARLNEPPRVPQGGMLPELQGVEADTFKFGMEADKTLRGGVKMARDIAEKKHYEPALNAMQAAESRLPTKTLFTPQDQRAWMNELNFLREKFRTILASNQGQKGPAYFKLGQLADLLDRGAQEGGIVNAHGVLRLYREINKSIPWEGGDIKLPGEAKQVAVQLRGTMLDMLEKARANAPESARFLVNDALSRWKTAREIHRSAYGVEGSLEQIPASKQIAVGKPGEKVREVAWADRFGKALTDPAGDFSRRRADLDAQIENMFTTAKMPVAEMPRVTQMASEFQANKVKQQLSQIINEEGAELSPKTLQKIDELRRATPPDSVQELDVAYRAVEESLKRQKVDPTAAMNALFAPPSPGYSGKVSRDFETHALPALKAMPREEQQGVWRAVIQDRMERSGVTKRIVAPDDIFRILADPVVAAAPPEFQEALRSLASGELSDIIMGKIPKFPKEAPTRPERVPAVIPGPRPEKIQMDESVLTNPEPYGAMVLPDLRVPKVPLKVGETILHLKDLTKIDDLSALWMKTAITGHEKYGPKFVEQMRKFVGEDGWKRIQEGWKAIHGRDAQGEFEPVKLRAAINDPRLPKTIRENVIYDSPKDYATADELLRTVEMPIYKSTKNMIGTPEQGGNIILRRLGAIIQFFRANAATIGSSMGAGFMVGGTPTALATTGGSTLAAIYFSVLKPKAAARELLGHPSRTQKYLNMARQFNAAAGGAPSRMSGSFAATTDPKGDTRRER